MHIIHICADTCVYVCLYTHIVYALSKLMHAHKLSYSDKKRVYFNTST